MPFPTRIRRRPTSKTVTLIVTEGGKVLEASLTVLRHLIAKTFISLGNVGSFCIAMHRVCFLQPESAGLQRTLY